MQMMPKQKPEKSKQSYQTPPEFISAVKELLNLEIFTWDLAADAENAQSWKYFTKEDDALKQSWQKKGWMWLNPPYADIKPWVHKAFMESTMWGAHVAMLIPASVGSNWWKEWVHEKAQVYLLNGRITFVGMETPYPKDCALLLYRPMVRGGYSVWNWNAQMEVP